MKILAIDTSCDETAAAVTEGATVLSNVIWSQASLHAKFGGVMPSLAQRMHNERIDFVMRKALLTAHCTLNNIQAVAVTAGPGLAIALEVGVVKAKEIASKYHLPLIPVNHIEGHLLSSLAISNSQNSNNNSTTKFKIQFPALGLVASGGHTELILINKIGEYKILAQTHDDALGEALDKAARMLGLGYPGGAILEKMARLGNPKAYPLPLPMARSKDKDSFSYSGLKTAFFRLVTTYDSQFTAQEIYDMAACFQNRAFQHLIRVVDRIIKTYTAKDLLVGGGVAANIELRKRLRKMGKETGLKVRFPYSAKLVGDNAAMIGVAAGLRIINHCPLNINHLEQVDRRPRWSIDVVY